MTVDLVLEGVSYAYAGQPALREVSLRIAGGEYVALVGANGSGKSTLARHLNALLLPEAGRVLVGGLDTRDPAHHREIRRQVGMVFQRPEDQVVATVVEDDVAFGPENLGLPPAEIRARVDDALEAAGLARERLRPPHMLSAGQQQRLALAGVLAMRPGCIVFDEVTAMLDPAGRRDARALLRRLHAEGFTIITITHFMEEALDAARVVVLDAGRVVMDDNPARVFAQAATLRALGLDLPPVGALAGRLRRQLPALPTGLLTLPALVEAVDRLPHGHHPPDPPSAPAPGCPYIEIVGLGHVYMAGTPLARRALRALDMAVAEGGSHGLVGATGSGKSTLLQHINGLLRPQTGAVRVGEVDLGDPQADVRAVRRRVGLAFQRPEQQIFEQYVGDEIAYGPRLLGLPRAELRERVREAMALVGLDFEAFKDRLTYALSGGERRKVALAAMLALRPEALLLDEPTAGLDPRSRQEVWGHLRAWRGTARALVISSHQMEDLAALTGQMTVLAEGTAVLRGATGALFGDGARLRELGLGQPLAARVADALRARGWSLPAGLVTPEALVAAITGAVRRE